MSKKLDVIVRNIDFSECKYLGEMYAVLKRELELPAWYGENLDALWDGITGIMYTPAEIRINKTVGRKELRADVEEMIEVFREAEEKYGEITVVVTSEDE